jgi:hypothetical protein
MTDDIIIKENVMHKGKHIGDVGLSQWGYHARAFNNPLGTDLMKNHAQARDEVIYRHEEMLSN